VTTSIRASRLVGLLLLPPLVASLPGCTNLDETPTSSITPENFYRNEVEVLGGLAGVYAQLRNTTWAYYNLSEISTDEMIVPTRGQDWYDNGRWLEIHRQAWAANSPAGLDDVNAAWVDAFTGIARANVILTALENVAVGDKPAVIAELRTLRGFYYYMLMDFFGGVPIVTTTEIEPRAAATRAEVFEFIEEELLAAREDLPATPKALGRLAKGAADAILANMYLNAEVFTGTVSASGLQRGTARWQDAVTAADRIINSGLYSLANDWHAKFRSDNSNSPENILVVAHLNQAGLGLNFVMRALHYNQFNPSPWNGFSALAETYNAFDQDDQRRQIFLVGPQNNLETGQPVNDRTGQRLVFTPEINDATQATEGEGARIIKWPHDPNHVSQENGNDFAYFRLGEIYLIKAEALFELGNSAEALTLLNTLRAKVFNPPEPLTTIDRDVILRERLFELTAEAKRRQDLIRHGKYTQAWGFKPATDAFRILMPIPATQLGANPLLQQNAGY
jgi:starch-binding outer membrane protein, SusD/RagB family